MKYTVIKSKEQYNEYCRALEQLLITKSSEDEIELLTLLIESWDHKHNSIEETDGINVLRYLMREHGLKAVEVAVIPTGMALRLGRHFKLREEVFAIARAK
jgi:HTH-type transcriptional regulator/antitoxin HigA